MSIGFSHFRQRRHFRRLADKIRKWQRDENLRPHNDVDIVALAPQVVEEFRFEFEKHEHPRDRGEWDENRREWALAVSRLALADVNYVENFEWEMSDQCHQDWQVLLDGYLRYVPRTPEGSPWMSLALRPG